MLRKGKIVIYSIWILLIIGFGVVYFTYPEVSSPEYITNFIQRFSGEMLLIYTLISLIRGFFLIPSTPFVIAGGLLFPDQLFWVLLISMIGIMSSATALYYFSDLLGFSGYLNTKFPSKIEKMKSRMENSKSIFFIAGWSFFPFVPTDLICYVTGILKTPYKNVFAGVFVGEIILCTFYVYFGASIFSFL